MASLCFCFLAFFDDLVSTTGDDVEAEEVVDETVSLPSVRSLEIFFFLGPRTDI